MKKVVVASENPVKVEVARRAFARLFPQEHFEFLPFASESGVPDQPFNDETRRGARNRLDFIMREVSDADYWISQEGGLFHDGDTLFNKAWIMVRDKAGNEGSSATAHLPIPHKIAQMVLNDGMELGHAGNTFFNQENIKHGNGVIYELTDGAISRADYYEQAAVIALSQIVHAEWYRETTV